MATDFNTYGYVDDKGQIHAIRLASNTAAAQPSALPATAFTGIPVEARRGNRGLSLQIRGARLIRRVGTAPNDKAFTTFLPILKKADLDGLKKGDSITVGGVNWLVSRILPELNTGY